MRKLLVLISQSSSYRCFDRAKEEMYSKYTQNKMHETVFSDIEFSNFLVLSSK